MVGMRRSASSHFHSEHQPIRGCESVSRRKEYKFKSEVRAILGRFFFFQTCRYVQAFKMLGGNFPPSILKPAHIYMFGKRRKHGRSGPWPWTSIWLRAQTGGARSSWCLPRLAKEICFGVPVALSKVWMFPWNFSRTIPSFKQPQYEHWIQTKRTACPRHGSKLGVQNLQHMRNTQPSPGRKFQEVLTVNYWLASLLLIPLSLRWTHHFLFFSFLFVTPFFLFSSLDNSFSFSVLSLTCLVFIFFWIFVTGNLDLYILIADANP